MPQRLPLGLAGEHPGNLLNPMFSSDILHHRNVPVSANPHVLVRHGGQGGLVGYQYDLASPGELP